MNDPAPTPIPAVHTWLRTEILCHASAVTNSGYYSRYAILAHRSDGTVWFVNFDITSNYDFDETNIVPLVKAKLIKALERLSELLTDPNPTDSVSVEVFETFVELYAKTPPDLRVDAIVSRVWQKMNTEKTEGVSE